MGYCRARKDAFSIQLEVLKVNDTKRTLPWFSLGQGSKKQAEEECEYAVISERPDITYRGDCAKKRQS